MTRAGFIDKLGLDNICGDMDAALARARTILAENLMPNKNKKAVDSKNGVA
jgi:hypothetical protein